MSQRMLATRAGIDHSTISRIVSGDRSPAWSTVLRLAAALGVAPPSLRALDPVQRVRAALLDDPFLSAADREELGRHYLRLRASQATVHVRRGAPSRDRRNEPRAATPA